MTAGELDTYDLVVVGAGPAGAAAALGALHTDPRLRVALLDRAIFPRDKSCGDASHPTCSTGWPRWGSPGCSTTARRWPASA